MIQGWERFLSVDPITQEYPELTPYQFASNTPIWAIDIDGLEGGIASPMGGQNVVDAQTAKDVNAGKSWFSQPASRWMKLGLAAQMNAIQPREAYNEDSYPNMTIGQYLFASMAQSQINNGQSSRSFSSRSTRIPQQPHVEAETNVSKPKLKIITQPTPVQQAQAKANGGVKVKLQGAGGMFGGNQWLNKGIHANVEGIGQNVEIGFKLNAAGDDLSINIVNYKGNLNEKQRGHIIKLGQDFLKDKGNLQKIRGWFEAAKGNVNVPTSDHPKIDETIKVIDKKIE